jgi:hypothetical protein
VTVRVVVPLDPGSKEPERVVTSVTTDGDAGERIAMALSSAEAFDILQDLFDQIDALDPHRQDAIYDAAAILVSDEFHDAYVKRTRKMSRKIAFLKTRMDYVSGANKAKRRRETIDALRAALG